MDNNYRLKVKVGDHEFDGSGATDDVKEQFRDFKELVALALSAAQRVAVTAPIIEPATTLPGVDVVPPATAARADAVATDAALSKIMKVDNRVVSLTLRAQS